MSGRATVEPPAPSRTAFDLTLWLRVGAASLAILYGVMYVAVALKRIAYPFELEWMEGGCLDHVRRVLAGQPLYVPPTVEFVPFIYTPLYFYLTALVSIPFHDGFAPGRWLSFTASIGCLVLIYRIVRQDHAGRLPALLAAGLFVAVYRRSGAWFDIVRVDSLFLFFTLSGVLLLKRHRPSGAWVFAAGVLFSLAFLTKQIALGITLPILMALAFLDFKRFVPFAAALALGIGGTSLLLNRVSDGWYGFYVFTLPGKHRLLGGPLLDFWTFDLLAPFTIAMAIGAYFLVTRAAERGLRAALLDLSIAAGMIGASWIARLHDGGYSNVLFSAYAVIAIFFGLGLSTLMKQWDLLAPASRRRTERFVLALVIAQFLIPVYNPFGQLPRPHDAEAGRAVVEKIRRVRGDVWLSGEGYLATLAGKRSFAHAQAISDVERAGDSRAERSLQESMRRALDQRRFGMVILEDRNRLGDPRGLEPLVSRTYRPAEPLFTKDEDRVFWPATGTPIRPGSTWVPDSANRAVRAATERP